MKHDLGNLGYGRVGGLPAESFLNDFAVEAAYVGDPTTASTQVTGTGDGTYRVDIKEGIVTVDKKRFHETGEADVLLEAAGDIMASGYSKKYAVLYWMSADTGVIARKIVPGTAALTGAEVAPTSAEIEAALPDNASYTLSSVETVNRTGATTVTQSHDVLARPNPIPQTVNRL